MEKQNCHCSVPKKLKCDASLWSPLDMGMICTAVAAYRTLAGRNVCLIKAAYLFDLCICRCGTLRVPVHISFSMSCGRIFTLPQDAWKRADVWNTARVPSDKYCDSLGIVSGIPHYLENSSPCTCRREYFRIIVVTQNTVHMVPYLFGTICRWLQHLEAELETFPHLLHLFHDQVPITPCQQLLAPRIFLESFDRGSDPCFYSGTSGDLGLPVPLLNSIYHSLRSKIEAENLMLELWFVVKEKKNLRKF